MKKIFGKGFFFGTLILMALWVFAVSPVAALFIYIDNKWGESGILIFGALLVPLFLVGGTLLLNTLGHAANQHIWSNTAKDNTENQSKSIVQTMKGLVAVIKHIDGQKEKDVPTEADFDDFFAGIDDPAQIPLPAPGGMLPGPQNPSPWAIDTSGPAEVSDDLRID